MKFAEANPEACTAESNKHRFSEPTKFLPVVFVAMIIVTLWSIYTFYHSVPMLLSLPNTDFRGLAETVAFNFAAGMLVICYIRSLFTHPGTIPEKEEGGISPWEYVVPDAYRRQSPSGQEDATLETKRSGDRRYCKWCAKYKPDRCHHCRVCRTCILRMDHHCPWIYNCVGFRNHKFFFLLLFYSSICCILIVFTMHRSLQRAISPETPFTEMFALLFGETLASVLGFMVTVFLGFHVWLMQKALTTIEFCEKSMKRTGYDSSSFDRGLYKNIRSVLGDNPVLWLLPCSPPSGDGLSYVDEDAPLLHTLQKDVEAGRDIRKKSHEAATQRSKSAGTGELESDSAPEQDPFLRVPEQTGDTAFQDRMSRTPRS